MTSKQVHVEKPILLLSRCFFDSAAVEAELARQKLHLRGPEELQQATRFLHENGTENIAINSKHTGFHNPMKTHQTRARTLFEPESQMTVYRALV